MNDPDMLPRLLTDIAQAEAVARHHDRYARNALAPDVHGAAAQLADERAEAARRAARALIESAFPGVSWAMIENAAL